MKSLLEFMANKVQDIMTAKEADQSGGQSTNQSMGFGVSMPPVQIDDSAMLLQNLQSQAGIQNESVNNLVPAAPMMPLPQLPQRFMPQPPPISERERALIEDKKRIEEGRRPRLLE